MTASILFRSTIFALASLLAAPPIQAQEPSSSVDQLKSWAKIRKERVELLRGEIKQADSRIESRLDVIIKTLKTITDSKDSRTKVARMKEDTGKRLMKTISYYDQKRAALKEELRSPRLHLTAEEKKTLIAAFDARIEKRTNQIVDLNKSMPTHEDHDRYKSTGGGWWGTEYEQNEEYDQNRRMTSHSNTQRTAIVKQLDTSIARLDRQARTLQTQLTATKDPLQRDTLKEELAKAETLIAERRKQKLETLEPGGTPARSVAQKEAMDLDKAMQSAISDLRREFDAMFGYYNTYLQELSSLHATEAVLAAKKNAK